MSPFVLSCMLAIMLIAIDAQQQMTLHLFAKNTVGGQCLDGSPSGFYYSEPPSGSSNLWVIFLKGGGACYDKESCLQRANTSLGSSKHWKSTYDPVYSVNSNNPQHNPYFYQGHQVFAPYCSGDGWGGN